MPNRIEDYALIGDCETSALIGKNGSIDWLCWPRFDSAAVLARLLGTEDNGFWQISPASEVASVTRRYRGNTLILETDTETANGGLVTVVDFMPLRTDDVSHIVRIVYGRRGRVKVCSRVALRFGYGSIVPWVTKLGPGAIKAIAGPDLAVLRSDRDLKAHDFTHRSVFTLGPGESAYFLMSYGSSFGRMPDAIDPYDALAQTEAAWTQWTSNCIPNGPHLPQVIRSLVTLKALTYRQTGGIVAAPTTSLPERIKGSRNWDYRYCWLRDATFTLLALMNCGFHDEARAWRTWLRHAVAGNPGQVQIMYGLSGERHLTEWEIEWLRGYRASKPVRVGNAAAVQLQLDIFGEVMDALFQGEMMMLDDESFDWSLQLELVEHLESIWKEPDEGLWEVRGDRQHFTHSKVMAWVAFDRAIKSIERFGLDGPLERWRAIRQQIHAQICRRGYDKTVGSFVQSYGSSYLDASALLIPLVGFLPPSDPRIVSTVETIGRRLQHQGLIRRYDPRRTNDGMHGEEGAFLACSFWYADCLVLIGRIEEATTMFNRLVSLCNDVGLLAEEYDPMRKHMLGNFPQAFSHVALINTALNLSKREKPAEQRSQSQPPRQPLVEKPG